MKLKAWATLQGISYKTALRWFHSGKIPNAYQLDTDTILVKEFSGERLDSKIAIYSRVSTYEQKEHLKRQTQRLLDFCASKGYIVDFVVEEFGSGLNGKRPKLQKILRDNTITLIVVEHQDRLTRFGFEYIQAVLGAQGRTIEVLNKTERKDDVIADFIDVITCFCSKIYGRRGHNTSKKLVDILGEKS
jgi:predicted site-specific integrase-resolvase